MPKTILIIKAMNEEMALLNKQLTIEKEQVVGAFHFFESHYHDLTIITVVCGIGKVNAATCTAVGCVLYQPHLVINAGVAGGLHADLNVGDVIIASALSYHDVDVTTFGYAHGQVPRMPQFYSVDQTLAVFAQHKADEHAFKIIDGLICSGDAFISDAQVVLAIQAKIPDIVGLDMESCAIAQACHQLAVPFFCLRSISDAANEVAKPSYELCLTLAVNNVTTVLLLLLQQLSVHDQQRVA